jgi:nicotinamide mononucleotide transporter
MSFFSIDSIFFEILGYSMSFLEFTAVIFGLLAVWLSARANIWSWPLGIVNVSLAGIFYYQIQLYPDMFLQAFFFVTNLLGWWRWSHPKPGEEDKKKELRISRMNRRQFTLVVLVGIIGTGVMGALASRLHEWLPSLFSLPSAYPYTDSFILVMSITTTFLMVQKKVECWIIWIIIDVVATYLYFVKGALFFSLEYLIFTILAAMGLWHWAREYKSYP